MTKRAVVFLLLSVTSAQAREKAIPAMHLVAPHVELGSRLLGFDLHVRSGRVSAVRCPAGWKITADNDPSWNARVSGQAYVGAAALDIGDIERLIAITRVPIEDVVDQKQSAVHVSGSITLEHGDQFRTLSYPNLVVGIEH